MEFRVLGPLEVWRDGQRVSLGGPQPEKALAALLLAGDQVVPLDAMIAALWDGEPPPTAKHQIHKLIAALRRRIPGTIETDGRGYRIRLVDAVLDATTFNELAAVPTIANLTAALELWRGPALAGIDSRAVQAGAAGLNERRLAATETLVDLRLAAGQAAEVATELPALIATQPFREGLRGQLMVALYRCGRQAEALSVYAETRTLLTDELGVEPGPGLVRLHRQVLRADPALEPAAPRTLPYDLADFSGRGADMDRLLTVADTTADTVVISAIDGMAGIGKTALAVHAAHRLADRYPDGQLFFDLHAHTAGAQPVEPDVALEMLLRMLGIPAAAIPEGLEQRTARWRTELARRRVLVVLDNAASAAQVRPLLPGTPRCLALITSRRRLGVIEGATVVSLDVLPAGDALHLFGAVAGPARVAAEPTAAAEVIELCGRLPLAIRIAGTRLAQRPNWTVASLAQRLHARTGRLSELTLGDRGVGLAFAMSYAHLSPAQQQMFRLLGLHPGADFDGYSAAALADIPPRRAESLLEALVDAHLLRHSAAGRYTFHDLLREYAHGLARADGDEPLARLHDYFLAAATAAGDLISREARRFEPSLTHPPRHLPALADVDAALSFMTAEHQSLLALTAVTDDWQLACVLRAFFEHRGHFADWRGTHERALGSTTISPLGTALIRFNMGALAMWTDRLVEGMEHFYRALRANVDDRHLEATALTSLGMLAHLLHRDLEAAGYLRRALAIDHSNTRTTALGLNNLGLTEGRLGNRQTALEYHRKALAMARGIGSPSAERAVLLGLGETSLRLGLPAWDPFRQALDLARAGRFRMQEALALDGLAHTTGDPAYWREALAILTELGVAKAELVRRHLDNPGVYCCDLCRAAPPVNAARSGLVSASRGSGRQQVHVVDGD